MQPLFPDGDGLHNIRDILALLGVIGSCSAAIVGLRTWEKWWGWGGDLRFHPGGDWGVGGLERGVGICGGAGVGRRKRRMRGRERK